MSKLIDDIAVIGDVHGLTNRYVNIAKKFKYSVQVGDLGFNYNQLGQLDSNYHKLIPGNHDNYDELPLLRHSLGDFGTHCIEGLVFFFIRGADSIDKEYRMQWMMQGGEKCWWAEEVLPKKALDAAVAEYKTVQPDIMITHTCPTYIARQVGDGRSSNILLKYGLDPLTYTEPTQECLQECLDYHQPKLWIFGHFHKSVDFKPYKYPNTRFICLAELETLKLLEVIK